MFVSLIVLSQLRGVGPARTAALTVALAAVGLATSPSTLEVNSVTTPKPSTGRTERHITDERILFSDDASLLSAYRTREMPDHTWRWLGERGAPPDKRTVTGVAMGFRGLAAGPDIRLIDRAALTDPLLAWLPAQYEPRWMTGHFLRAVPAGYVETLETGENQLRDRKLAELYDRIDLIVSGPLWSRERLAAIWWLNTGGPEKLIDEERYRFYGAQQLKFSILSKRVPDGTTLENKRLRRLTATGAQIRFEERQHPRAVELSLNYEDHFELRFYDGTKEVARVPVPRAPKWKLSGMTVRTVELPSELQARGFTRLRLLPRTGERAKKPYYVLGHMLFDPEPEAEG
jgi:arabinofuranosyltransferase